MSKGVRKFTKSDIKRAVEAVQRSGLSVSGVRVSDDAIYIETRATEPPLNGGPSTIADNSVIL